MIAHFGPDAQAQVHVTLTATLLAFAMFAGDISPANMCIASNVGMRPRPSRLTGLERGIRGLHNGPHDYNRHSSR
ncbi:MAG: hypothetical protein WAV45_09090 [Propionibacteriaceae bacterium]|nr:hypothetical protein [Micropruina sp.]